MELLVSGGAGYIGSVCVEELIRKNYRVIVIDDLREGHRIAVSPEADFYEGDFGNRELLETIFRNHNIEAVIHFAAETTVEISMRDPHLYFQNNVVNGLVLLDVMKKYHCRKIIFSSTAAIFGSPEYIPIDEKHPKAPINAYGESKAMFEKILDWYHMSYGFQFNAFRYFNAAGATIRYGEAHKHETHLIPMIIEAALGKRENIYIFGSDYETKDGTCVRDYLHVVDIAQAHILGLKNLNDRPAAKYNLGNGSGFTNLEVLNAVEKISGRKVPHEFADRRSGDPDKLIALPELAKAELGWNPKYKSLESIIGSALEWHEKHPYGYEEYN
jgi:UDP-glucose 4-epimerase